MLADVVDGARDLADLDAVVSCLSEMELGWTDLGHDGGKRDLVVEVFSETS